MKETFLFAHLHKFCTFCPALWDTRGVTLRTNNAAEKIKLEKSLVVCSFFRIFVVLLKGNFANTSTLVFYFYMFYFYTACRMVGKALFDLLNHSPSTPQLKAPWPKIIGQTLSTFKPYY